MTQTKLTKEQISNCRKIARLLDNEALAFRWLDTEEGSDYWVEVFNKLREKIHHRTSDGKPYVEAEPPIPEGYRKANADEWRRKDVKYWDLNHKDWLWRLSQGIAFDPPVMQTRYIVPIDPPLTDQDAAVWPRLLVMVRDEDRHLWIGPYKYLGKTDASYSIDPNNGGCATDWKQARRATPEEIEAAK